MSLNKNELLSVILEMKPLLAGLRIKNFFQIDARKFILHAPPFRVLLCLQEPFLRVHLVQKPKGEKEFSWTKDLREKVIKTVEMLNNDRIAKLTFTDGASIVAELFPKNPNLYFLDDNGTVVHALNPVENKSYRIPNITCQNEPLIDYQVTSASIEARYERLEFEKKKQVYVHQLKNHIKRLNKEHVRVTRNLETSEGWPSVQHEGQLLLAYRGIKKGLTEVFLEDWEQEGKLKKVSLDPKLTSLQEAEKRFKISKKLKASLPYIQDRLKKIELEKNVLQERMDVADALEVIPDLPSLSKPKKDKAPALPYHEFFSRSGLKIWVGKNAKSNEKLSFNYAKGSDWWFHVSGFPGSHVVLKVLKNQEPDSESIEDALQLALNYSKARDKKEAEVIMTQCKYLSKLGRSMSGKVQISKHKIQYVRKKDSAR